MLPRKHRRRLRALAEIEQRLIKRGDDDRLARVQQEKAELEQLAASNDEEEALLWLI